MVKLTRAAGPRPGRSEWQLVTLAFGDPDAFAVIFGCPLCAALGITGPPVHATAGGIVATLLSCSSGQCAYSYQAYLEGWGQAFLEGSDAPSTGYTPTQVWVGNASSATARLETPPATVVHDAHCCAARGCHDTCSHLCGTVLAISGCCATHVAQGVGRPA